MYIETDEFTDQGMPFSMGVQYGDMLYLSGQVGALVETGELLEGGIRAETRQTMLNIKSILEANGSSLDQVIKCTYILADIAEWGAMSED
ncbi:MAG: 2-iminobutanoate/2-iminopropanoate deaminase [Algoriphagus sp.]|jgi:2-iminobutanoate/2-iminopropanoate deaminase|tara:strand:- start:198 stop:467 length:270 start_codon:yes stop_codon:yes gene_type:complete